MSIRLALIVHSALWSLWRQQQPGFFFSFEWSTSDMRLTFCILHERHMFCIVSFSAECGGWLWHAKQSSFRVLRLRLRWACMLVCIFFSLFRIARAWDWNCGAWHHQHINYSIEHMPRNEVRARWPFWLIYLIRIITFEKCTVLKKKEKKTKLNRIKVT